MENDNKSSKILSFDDFVAKCRIMDEACRQWCDFIDEAPERRNGHLFTEFYAEISKQKYQEYLNDPAYRDNCNCFAALSDKEKYNIDFLKPSNGRTVRKHQPKAPARDTGAR